jgi:DNA-binding NarL/FixJ family response regulator
MFRVLIADDNSMVRRGLKRLIENSALGYEVCGEAVNGKDAIARAEELNPDLLILDLAMPEMNGLEAAREIAKKKPLPILLCTLHLSAHVIKEARRSGIQGAVSKAEVRQILDGMAALLRHETFYANA